MKTIWLINFLVIFGLLACSESHPIKDGSGLPTLGKTNDADGFSATQRLPISCIGNGCLQGVGILHDKISEQNSSKEFKGVATGQCTGFLVSDRVVATSFECVQSQSESENCSDWLEIQFPVQASVDIKSTYKCKTILNTSGESKLFAPDFAFFEIEPTSRKPLLLAKAESTQINSLELKHYQPVTLFTSQSDDRLTSYASSSATSSASSSASSSATSSEGAPNSDAAGATKVPTEFTSVNCQVIYGSLLNPKSSTAFSSSQLASLCENEPSKSIKENSGSPVFNKSGEVIGILQSSRPTEFSDWISVASEKYGIVYESDAEFFNFTNLACIKNPQIDILPQECSAQNDGDIFSELEKQRKALNLQKSERIEIRTLIDSMRSVLPRLFKYRFQHLLASSKIIALPRCALTETQSKGVFHYADVASRRGIFWGSVHAELKSQNTVNYRRRYQADKNYVLSPNSAIEEISRSSTIYNIEKKGVTWHGTMQENSQEGVLSDPTRIEIPECSDQQAISADPLTMASTK